MRGNYSEQSGRGKWAKSSDERGLVKIGHKWYVRYSVNGKVRTEGVGPSREYARKVLAKRKTEILDGKFFPNQIKKNISLTEIIDDQLKRDKDAFAAKGHDKRRKFSDGRHRKLKEWFGERAAASVTAEEFEEKIAGHAKTAATHNHYRIVLSKTFKLAVKNRKVASSPVSDIGRRKLNNTRIRYVNQFKPLPTGNPELDRLSTEEERLRAAIRMLCPAREAELDLALATGLRYNEQLQLTWDDVDFDAKIATLRHTKAGEAQHVKLSPSAIRALARLRAQDQESKLVCPADARDSNRRADWDRVRALVKLDEKSRGEKQAFHWHDLRHTFASRLVMAGVDILAVKELMRHKTLDVTLRYAHLAPDHLVEALDKLDSYSAKCKESVKAVSEAPAAMPQAIQ